MKTKLLLFIFLLIGISANSQEIAKGYVFEDSNNNGKKDRREAGVPNVAVSNGVDVVITDENGFYSLPVYDDNTIFVIKPSGYKTAVDEDFIPQFYYHHKPYGSPEDFTYKGVAPTGKLPSSIDFPLYKYNESEEFNVVVFGDPQPYFILVFDYLKERLVIMVRRKEEK